MDRCCHLLALALPALASGFVYGAGSALSVGPNNMMLLREGLNRRRVGTTLAAVLVSYFSLLVLAAGAADWLATVASPVRSTASWAGFAALVWFASRSLYAAMVGAGLQALYREDGRETVLVCLRRVLPVVWLNPLTYIELVLLPAVLCETIATAEGRTGFVLGLCLGNFVSCLAYCLCGRVMAPLVQQRRAMQLVDLISGVVMARAAAIVAVQLILAWPVGGVSDLFQTVALKKLGFRGAARNAGLRALQKGRRRQLDWGCGKSQRVFWSRVGRSRSRRTTRSSAWRTGIACKSGQGGRARDRGSANG